MFVMIVGLVLSHMLSVAIYTSDRRSTINLVGGEHISERMITLARLIEGAPPGERQKLARLASESVLNVSLGETPNVSDEIPRNLEEKILREVFTEHLSHYGLRSFRLSYRDAEPGEKGLNSTQSFELAQGSQKLMQVSLQLAGGGWLNCSALIETSSSIWSLRFLLSLVVMTLAVIVVSIIVVYRINLPLRTFARAAHRLGTNIEAPPLPVTGPREMKEAINSFNGMQERLKRLINDRRQMLAAVSHDMRTPITLLRLRAEFVENDDEREKMLATLADMESMVNSILGFVRDEATEEEIRSVDIAALLNAICDDIGDLGGKVSFSGPDRLIYPCRPAVLKRALANVIDNAVKFGGNAYVELRDEDESIAIIVEDAGPGIPEAEIESVFDPFYRIEDSRSRDTGGVGLGLSVARSVIDAHGGHIALANRPEGGLCVTIALPGQYNPKKTSAVTRTNQ